MSDYEKLRTWKRAHALVLRVHEITRSFPASERGGLTAALRGAAMSIAMRLVEGCGRHDDAELVRCARAARDQTNELHYLTRVAMDVRLVSAIDATRLFASIDEVRRLLDALESRLGRDIASSGRLRRRPDLTERPSRRVLSSVESRAAPEVSRR